MPIRVLVSEPDAVSHRILCSLLECESGMTVTCVDASKLVSSIRESAPDLVIVDVHTLAIRRAPNWETVESGLRLQPLSGRTIPPQCRCSLLLHRTRDWGAVE